MTNRMKEYAANDFTTIQLKEINNKLLDIVHEEIPISTSDYLFIFRQMLELEKENVQIREECERVRKSEDIADGFAKLDKVKKELGDVIYGLEAWGVEQESLAHLKLILLES